MNRRLYAIHRWISAIAVLQLAIWSLTGAFFVIVPIGTVRGEGVEGAHDAVLPDSLGVISPATAQALAGQYGLGAVSSLDLRATPSGLWYFARRGDHTVRIDARSGEFRPVELEEAEDTARRDQGGGPVVRSSALLTEAPIEYRGKPLPAWRVQLDDEAGTAIYVDVRTGEVTARRNDRWRTYDFLWSLHIMDYKGRENFNHPLLIVAVGLALLTVFSGVTLWVVRLVRRWRSRARGDGGPMSIAA